MCDAAEALVVKISAVWTRALACAGGRPIASKAVFDKTPKAMPSEPSTSCAPNPTAKNNHQVSKEIAPLSRQCRFYRRRSAYQAFSRQSARYETR